MQDHPLTPMTDPNLVRVLQAQVSCQVGLIDYKCVAQGKAAIQARIAQLTDQGVKIAVVDAVSNDDLYRLGPALAQMPLLTAGSGVAIALGTNFDIAPNDQAGTLPKATGFKAVVSGSCSRATNAQVAEFITKGGQCFMVNPLALDAAETVINEALAWAEQRLGEQPILIYSTAQPDDLKTVQQKLGVEQAGALVEQTLASIAVGLCRLGVKQLVVAGGETSGAVVQALQIDQLQIGSQIDPGVPWCGAYSRAIDAVMHITLKSGNFGSVDFFTQSFERLA
jgi:uncharacterized protein YgbK (DUF1537 family)